MTWQEVVGRKYFPSGDIFLWADCYEWPVDVLQRKMPDSTAPNLFHSFSWLRKIFELKTDRCKLKLVKLILRLTFLITFPKIISNMQRRSEYCLNYWVCYFGKMLEPPSSKFIVNFDMEIFWILFQMFFEWQTKIIKCHNDRNCFRFLNLSF